MADAAGAVAAVLHGRALVLQSVVAIPAERVASPTGPGGLAGMRLALVARCGHQGTLRPSAPAARCSAAAGRCCWPAGR